MECWRRVAEIDRATVYFMYDVAAGCAGVGAQGLTSGGWGWQCVMGNGAGEDGACEDVLVSAVVVLLTF